MTKYEAQYLEFYQEEIIKAFEEFDSRYLAFFDSSKPEILKSEDNALIVEICYWVRDYIIHLNSLTNRCSEIFQEGETEANKFFTKLYENRPYLRFPDDFAQFDPALGDFDNYVGFEDNEAQAIKAIFSFEKYKNEKNSEISSIVSRKTEELLMIRSFKLIPYHALLIPKLNSLKLTLQGDSGILENFIDNISITQNSSIHRNHSNEILNTIKHKFPTFFNIHHYDFGFNLFNEFLLEVSKLRKDKEFNKPDVIYIFSQLKNYNVIPSAIGSEQLNEFLKVYNPMMNQKPFPLIKGNEIRSDRADSKRKSVWNKLEADNKEQITLISKDVKNQ